MNTTIKSSKSLDNDHNKKPLSDTVYEHLITKLISLEFPPGSRLTVDALARDFGVSQTPIRAALIRLRTEGLIESKHNSGFWVSPIPTEKYYNDSYQVRLLLEPEAAAMAAENARTNDVRQLQDICTQMEELVIDDTKKNYGRFAILDDLFHKKIIALSGNELMDQLLDSLHAHMHLFRLRYHASVAEDAIKEHKEIVEAILYRDAEKARSVMAEHILSSSKRMVPYYKVNTYEM